MSHYLDLGEDVEIVEEPIEQEEAPHDDVEHIVHRPLLSQQILDLLRLVDALEESEQLASVTHVGWVETGVLKRESNFL